MTKNNTKAFTMIELVFVIVIIGILSAVAIPKFAATRGDAEISKAKATVAAVRNSITMEKQKRILRGDFTNIFRLTSSAAASAPIFDIFDNNATMTVLSYPLISCANGTDGGCWRETTVGTAGGNGVYTYNMPVNGTAVFTLINNRFTCVTGNANCDLLTQ